MFDPNDAVAFDSIYRDLRATWTNRKNMQIEIMDREQSDANGAVIERQRSAW